VSTPFRRFDPFEALNEIRGDLPAKAAKPAKDGAETLPIRGFRNFSIPPGSNAETESFADARRRWADELRADLERWLSVHPAALLARPAIRDRVQRRRLRFEVLIGDYVRTGEPGDRRAALFAANAVAAEAGAAVREVGGSS
jgi:hypothetical protein